jgi:hypothetical protein
MSVDRSFHEAGMDTDSQTVVLAAMAGVFCLLAVLLLVGLVVYNARRSKPAAARPPATPAAPPARPPGLDIIAGPAAGADGAYDEEEMPTVVVNQPERPVMPPKASAMPPAPQRSSGATIIAFDEEEEEENG